ncbi:MAG: hypothetical protein IJR00_08140 [Lachnospiraceae bacterium]|nr:hypothetical protein [Lachnospiraceae bacterium]
MNTIILDINNGGKMHLLQRNPGGRILTMFIDEKGENDTSYDNPDALAFISPADMVSLINLYRHIKRNDIKNDFINPHGVN